MSRACSCAEDLCRSPPTGALPGPTGAVALDVPVSGIGGIVYVSAGCQSLVQPPHQPGGAGVDAAGLRAGSKGLTCRVSGLVLAFEFAGDMERGGNGNAGFFSVLGLRCMLTMINALGVVSYIPMNAWEKQVCLVQVYTT